MNTTTKSIALLIAGSVLLSCNFAQSLVAPAAAPTGTAPATATIPIPTATSPSSTQAITATASETVPDPSGAKNEIVEFMLDYIVKNEIEAMIDIFNTEDVPGIEEPPATFIIIFSPVSQSPGSDDSDLMNALDTKNAEQVWVYENGSLTEPPDKQAAIQEYQDFMHNAPDFPSIFMWGYNEFGILSISDDGQQAEVYLSSSCGSLCGHGVVFTLARNGSQQWEIKGTKLIWVS